MRSQALGSGERVPKQLCHGAASAPATRYRKTLVAMLGQEDRQSLNIQTTSRSLDLMLAHMSLWVEGLVFLGFETTPSIQPKVRGPKHMPQANSEVGSSFWTCQRSAWDSVLVAWRLLCSFLVMTRFLISDEYSLPENGLPAPPTTLEDTLNTI